MCPIRSSNWWDSTCFMALITEIRSPAGESTVLNCNGDFNLYCRWDSSSVIQALMLWNIFPRYENYLISVLALENPAEKCNKRWNIAPDSWQLFSLPCCHHTGPHSHMSSEATCGWLHPSLNFEDQTSPQAKSHYPSSTITIWKLLHQRTFTPEVLLF